MAEIGVMKKLTIGGSTYTIPEYSLPVASASTLGGVKIGTGLTINSTTGVLSATGLDFDEADPVFTASAAYGITSSDITNWNSKTSNTGTITKVQTSAGAHTTVNVSSGNVSFNVPTKTSHLTNDSGFLTSSDLASVLKYKGTKASVANLPTTGNVTGDVWHITADGSEYAWDGSIWQELGTAVDLSGYVPTSRTINSKALSSDISLTYSDVGAAASSHTHGNITNGGDITATAPTIENGDQIIINDNSASKITNGPTFDGSTTTTALTPKGTWETFSKFSGSYADLTDKPTIPTDTNTWRTIQVNGSDILGSGINTGKLNLKAGTNISLSNSSGTVTITGPDLSNYATLDDIGQLGGGTVTSITLKAGSGIALDTDNTAITTTGTRTISHSDTSSQVSVSNSGRTYIQSITLDGFGHVTALSSATETVTDSDKKLEVAAVTSGTTYYPIVGTGTTAATRQYDTTGFVYKGTNGTTSAVGSAQLTLGNSTASGTANNKQGQLIMYGSNAKKATITLAAPSADISLALPTSDGTLALTSQIPTVPTSTGSSATGITASTTATKTTLGTAGSVTGVQSSTTTASKVTVSGSDSFSATVTSHVLSFSHSAKTVSASDVTVPIKNTSSTSIPNVSVESATVSITDPGHTHTI